MILRRWLLDTFFVFGVTDYRAVLAPAVLSGTRSKLIGIYDPLALVAKRASDRRHLPI